MDAPTPKLRDFDIPPAIGTEPGKTKWTSAKFRSLIRGALRQQWFRWGGRNLAIQAARVEILTRKKTGEGYKKNVSYRCAECGALGKVTVSVKHNGELKLWKKRNAETNKMNRTRFKQNLPPLDLEPRPTHIPLKVAVDHKEALVPTDGTVLSWDTYLFRLFCGPENLQVLCEICHRQKSKTENAERKSNVRERNLETRPRST